MGTRITTTANCYLDVERRELLDKLSPAIESNTVELKTPTSIYKYAKIDGEWVQDIN